LPLERLIAWVFLYYGIVDTNSDPKNIDFIIPANDDATNSIEVILEACCAAISEGLEERKVEKADEKLLLSRTKRHLKVSQDALVKLAKKNPLAQKLLNR
jgi:small subunit ribosomal protein S2